MFFLNEYTKRLKFFLTECIGNFLGFLERRHSAQCYLILNEGQNTNCIYYTLLYMAYNLVHFS